MAEKAMKASAFLGIFDDDENASAVATDGAAEGGTGNATESADFDSILAARPYIAKHFKSLIESEMTLEDVKGLDGVNDDNLGQVMENIEQEEYQYKVAVFLYKECLEEGSDPNYILERLSH